VLELRRGNLPGTGKIDEVWFLLHGFLVEQIAQSVCTDCNPGQFSSIPGAVACRNCEEAGAEPSLLAH
jgi:hypothetical protein